jgi:hypothetical protein
MRLAWSLHKWAGLAAALLVTLVSVTGILLVHRKSLGLDRVQIAAPGYSAPSHPDAWAWLALGPGREIAATKQGVFLSDGDAWRRTLASPARRVERIGQRLFALAKDGLHAGVDGERWERVVDDGEARALRADGAGLWLSTVRGLHFAADGGAWQRVSVFPGAGLDVRELHLSDGRPLLVAKEGVFHVTAEGLLHARPFPRVEGTRIDLQRLVTDLHTGDFFGRWAFVAVDATAAVLVLLAITGAYIWWLPWWKRRTRPR